MRPFAWCPGWRSPWASRLAALKSPARRSADCVGRVPFMHDCFLVYARSSLGWLSCASCSISSVSTSSCPPKNVRGLERICRIESRASSDARSKCSSPGSGAKPHPECPPPARVEGGAPLSVPGLLARRDLRPLFRGCLVGVLPGKPSLTTRFRAATTRALAAGHADVSFRATRRWNSRANLLPRALLLPAMRSGGRQALAGFRSETYRASARWGAPCGC